MIEDVTSPTERPQFYRKILCIAAEDSPNVRYARAQIATGKTPDNRILVPGVVSWEDFQKHDTLWDEVKKCIGLRGQFYEGSEVLLYPPEWLDYSSILARQLQPRIRKAKAIGVDTAQGGDRTAMCVIDEWGIIELVSKPTPDTNVIPGEILMFMHKYNVPGSCVMLDTGGGGREHADRLRAQGYAVRTVAFGSPASAERKRRGRGRAKKTEERTLKELKYTYKNKRAEMYGILRQWLNPSREDGPVFAIPGIERGEAYGILRQELAPIPLLYDGEQRLVLPSKYKRNPNSTERCLTEIIGHSPDHADCLVTAIECMRNVAGKARAGAWI